MNLLYLTFGDNLANHTQAQFSIYSFLVQPGSVATINVVTDRPALYKNLRAEVQVIEVNKSLLKEWAGPHEFFWRIKIKAIEMLCQKYADQPVVYLDADTFLYTGMAALEKGLRSGIAFMHEKEGTLAQGKTKTEQRMWKQAGGKVFGPTTITASHAMWNAGVVATPNTINGTECLLALSICDAMCAGGITRRLIEQFALSVALQETYGLQKAEDFIAHYWSVKAPWTELISQFFTTVHFQQLSLPESIEQFKRLDLSKLPIKVKERNTRRRLERLVGKAFPAKETIFLNT